MKKGMGPSYNMERSLISLQEFEVFDKINLLNSKKAPFSLAKRVNCEIPKDAHITLVNGVFDPSFCKDLPKNLIVLPLRKALLHFSALLQTKLNEEKNEFSRLNEKFFEEGLFIYVPEKMVIEQALNLSLLYTKHAENSFPLYFPRIHIYLGRDASLRINFFEDEVEGGSFLSVSHIDFGLDERASLIVNSFSNLKDQSHHQLQMNSSLKGGSRFLLYGVAKGAKSARWELQAELMGSESEVNYNLAFPLKMSRSQSLLIDVQHKVKNAKSLQKIKSVLKDESSLEFEGKIGVSEGADGTSAYQISKALLLSKNAKAKAKPTLEIYADEVKATHGATMGQINEEELFYLRARGISEEEAKRLITEGFLKEIFNLFPIKERNMAYEFSK